MKKYNVIIVFDEEMKHILMCHRTKEPYKGLYNLPGGKEDPGESSINAAYRELYEETGIDSELINLSEVMTFDYNITQISVKAYVGKLSGSVSLIEEVNPLSWVDVKSDFFDMTQYAGMGNIGHMMEEIKYHRANIFEHF